MESGRIGVELTVSDGTAATTGIVFFAIHAADSLGAQIDPISQDAISAVPVTVDLSPYIHATGTHTPLLTDVTAPENTSATANGSDMTVSFTAASPGTYHVPFTVRQGRQQSAGIIRFNVSPTATERSTPITTNDVVVLGANGTAILEPLSNDLDPMGGVLSLASASAPPDTTIRTTVVARNRVHLEARHPLDAPITITYTAVNAVGTSQGSIIVHPASTVSGPALIRAEDFTVPVRCGGTRTVDVLSHIRYDEDAGMTHWNMLSATRRRIAPENIRPSTPSATTTAKPCPQPSPLPYTSVMPTAKNHPNRAISKPESPQVARYASPSHLAASTMPTT